jgi:hypothetical protein
VRSPVVLAVLAITSLSARAEPVVQISGGVHIQSPGKTWHDADVNQNMDVLGGMRVTLAFEGPLPPPLPPGHDRGDPRLVPELFAGVQSSDRVAEGYVGAGLRAELRVTTYRHDGGGFYFAPRAFVIGAHRDAGGEIAAGWYLAIHDQTRFGMEGAVTARPSDRAGAHEIGVNALLYVGWAL